MALFYFDLAGDDGNNRDDEGSELPSLAKARDVAIGLLPDSASYSVRRNGNYQFSVTVRDEMGKSIYRVTMTFKGEMLD